MGSSDSRPSTPIINFRFAPKIPPINSDGNRSLGSHLRPPPNPPQHHHRHNHPVRIHNRPSLYRRYTLRYLRHYSRLQGSIPRTKIFTPA
ncbi:hypothetical protein L2E82_18468 [Cichorium intybus]|uniref:Uncharacterized protein n=1 Tax=Cichorium intybus TaxID=13427 RepID=A0ACB9FAH2_CICIN|nr:hypothetical protein L2E82_18468 [Cichorium intybus]